MADTKETEVPTPEAKPVPESRDERMQKSVDKLYGEAVAAETATETPETTEAEAAEGTDKPVETKEAPKVEEPFTVEQLSSPKFYDSLNKEGWEKLKQQDPVVYERVRAGYVATSKMYEDARQAKAKADKPTEAASDAQQPKQLSPEIREAIRKKNSLDENEAAEGEREFQRLTLQETLSEFGFDANEAKAKKIYRDAYAVVIESLPAVAKYSDDQLGAAVEANPSLMNMLEIAAGLPDRERVAITANVMRMAADAVIAGDAQTNAAATAAQKAKDEQTKKRQAKERSNASIPSNVVVESPSSRATTGKKPMGEFVEELYAKAVAEQANS